MLTCTLALSSSANTSNVISLALSATLSNSNSASSSPSLSIDSGSNWVGGGMKVYERSIAVEKTRSDTSVELKRNVVVGGEQGNPISYETISTGQCGEPVPNEPLER